MLRKAFEKQPHDSIDVKKNTQRTSVSKSVFIVHGHDEEARAMVARFIEHLGLEPIILHERPNSGKTVIEKLESNSEEISFAVVLLTPDDKVAPLESEEYKYRARQNVIYELGYFNAKLGRSHVCVLRKAMLKYYRIILEWFTLIRIKVELGRINLLEKLKKPSCQCVPRI
jgi:predicted nucleotide-binding protein